ncbi:hypothetical protein DAEQUDRAFT_770695 [Daedalea quercina L-15889]|uniref:Endonuclease/exonuclease/phosphatase domain-containing protein n=1 Tax=Daedalea quercina L-15889 TaxID=1314783 RepID=A0A165KNE1_9APHY|nr:hypothetical protein DAEQUDRAFT_770695 [Daedalea quercina L-15889]
MLDATDELFNPEMEVEGQRKMILLEETLQRATELLKDISIHAEYPDAVLENAEMIATRLTTWKELDPATIPKPTEQTPTTEKHDNKILEAIAKTMDRINTEANTEPTITYATTTRKPVRQTTTVTTSPVVPKTRTPKVTHNPLSAHHPSRLIVEIKNGPTADDRPKETVIVKYINEVLQAHDESRHLRVVNIKFNAQNNCIIFTRADQSAGELIAFAPAFVDFFVGTRETRIRTDEKWHKVQLNGVLTHNDQTGTIATPQEIENKLQTVNPDYAKMAVHDHPRWMRHRGDLGTTMYSSVVLALKTQADAEHLVNRVNAASAGPSATQNPDVATTRDAASAETQHTQKTSTNALSAEVNKKTMTEECVHHGKKHEDPKQHRQRNHNKKTAQAKPNVRKRLSKKRFPELTEEQHAEALKITDDDFAAAVAFLERNFNSPNRTNENNGAHNAVLHALLNTTTDTDSADIILVTEPWWGNIGNETQGPVSEAAAGWTPILPVSTIPANRRPRVMAYIRRRGDFKVTLRSDIANDLDMQVLKIAQAPHPSTIVVNIYNDDCKQGNRSAAKRLRQLDLPTDLPVVLSGNWNIHHPMWSRC